MGGAGDSSYNREDVISQIEDEAPPLIRVIDREAIASRAALNPLAGGGWDGLTGLSIAAVGAAVGIASLLYGAAAARGDQGRQRRRAGAGPLRQATVPDAACRKVAHGRSGHRSRGSHRLLARAATDPETGDCAGEHGGSPSDDSPVA